MYRIGPIKSKPNRHSREKCLICLVLATLCLLCFAGIFLLPDNFGGEKSSLMKVYKQFQKAGPEIFIPAPPLAGHSSHGEDDPHFVGDRQKLQAKIREELGDIIEKPKFQRDEKESAEKEIKDVNESENGEQGAAPPLNGDVNVNDGGGGGGGGGEVKSYDAGMENNINLPVGNVNLPFPGGGNADPDLSVQEKRNKVKELA